MYEETVGGIEDPPLLIMKTRFEVFPRNTGFNPNGTIPTLESPETSMCISLPSPPAGGSGLVDKVIACASAPGSPEGEGTGTMNCRNVSLQPAARTIRMPRDSSHIVLKLAFIQTPPVLPV